MPLCCIIDIYLGKFNRRRLDLEHPPPSPSSTPSLLRLHFQSSLAQSPLSTSAIALSEPECLQMAKRRKKKRVKRSHDSSADTLAYVYATKDNSGEKNTFVEEAGVYANSNDDSDRMQEAESITLQEMMMKVKKNKKRLTNLQPTTVLPSQEEAELLKEGGKKRKKRKKDLCSHQTFASKDEEQLGMITQVSSDFHADISVPGNTVCETVDVNEDEVDAESKKDLSTINPTELATFQMGGKKNKRKKKKRKPEKILNNSQPAELLSSLGDGCLEKAQNIGFDEAHVSATENTTSEENGCVDEANIDVHSKKGSNIIQAEELVTSQEERKKKKRKKAKINHQPTDLPASQKEGCLEKIQKVSLPEISGTGKNTISETGDHVNKTEESAISNTKSCTIQTTESASIQKGGKTKKRKTEDLNSPQSAEFIASQEKGIIQSTQYVGSDPDLDISGTDTISREDSDEIEMDTISKDVLNNPLSTESLASQEKQLLQRTHTVGSDPQIDITATGSFIGRDSEASEIDANLTKDMNNSQTSALAAVEEEKKRKNQQDSSCVQPMQMPTAVEEGNMNKKQKKDSISSHPEQLDTSHEEVVLERIPARVSQSDLSAEDNSVFVKHSCIDETEGVTNEKIEATSSQAAKSIELQKEGKKKRKELNDAQLVELFELEDGDEDKKQKKHLQHLNPTESSMSQEEKRGKMLKHEQSIACQGREDAHGNKAETGFVNRNEIMLIQGEKGFSPVCLTTGSAETVDGNETGLVSIKETIEVSTSPELISGHTSGNNLSDELMVDKLNGELNREQNTSMKAKEFVSTDSAPSNFSKEDVTSEDIKNITEWADEELKRTSPGGIKASSRSSENNSNGEQLDKHCTSVKELEITTMKIANLSCPNLDVLHDESKKTTISMNVATENNSISRVMIPLKTVPDVRAKKLLILDVNGLLVDIIPNSECPTSRQPDLNVSKKSVFKRPYCSDFLRFCFENFAVGVWSSRTWKNLDRVVKFLFRDSERNLLFCWDRSNCTRTGLSTIDDPNKPLVLKELRRLWRDRKTLPWRRGVFDASNTLLLDDSPYKALRNPVHTAIFPYSYKFTDAEDSALGPEGNLRKYLERLLEARNVQEFVSENPFGQGPITASHPSWRFYCKIIIGE